MKLPSQIKKPTEEECDQLIEWGKGEPKYEDAISHDNARHLDVHKWSDYSKVNSMVTQIKDEIVPLLPTALTSRDNFKKNLKTVLLDLYVIHQEDPRRWIAYHRSKSNYKVNSRYNKLHISGRYIPGIMDALENLGYIKNKHGVYFSDFKRISRARAKPKLINAINESKVKVGMVSRIHEEVILRDKNGNYVEYKNTRKSIGMCNFVKELNKHIQTATIELPRPSLAEILFLGLQAAEDNYYDMTYTSLYRVFNEKFTKGGRFYGHWVSAKHGTPPSEVLLRSTPIHPRLSRPMAAAP